MVDGGLSRWSVGSGDGAAFRFTLTVGGVGRVVSNADLAIEWQASPAHRTRVATAIPTTLFHVPGTAGTIRVDRVGPRVACAALVGCAASPVGACWLLRETGTPAHPAAAGETALGGSRQIRLRPVRGGRVACRLCIWTPGHAAAAGTEAGPSSRAP